MIAQSFVQKIDKIISKSIRSQIGWLAVLIVFVYVVLLIISVLTQPLQNGETVLLRIWHIVGHFLEPGSFFTDDDGNSNALILIINLLGMTLLGGLLVSVLTNIMERRVERVNSGQVSYRFYRHIAIIGCNRMLIGLLNQIDKKHPQNKIVIQTNQDVPDVRQRLFALCDRQLCEKITFVNGSRILNEDLETLHLPDAIEIFILGETDEINHDSLNIDCLKKTVSILKQSGANYKKCKVLFDNQSTYKIFQQQNIDEIRTFIDFVPFNFCESWAQKVFVDNHYTLHQKNDDVDITYLPLDRDPLHSASDRNVHLIILGMSEMGITMGVQAMLICHFPNFVEKGIKTRITFIDTAADLEIQRMQMQYANLFNEIEYVYRDIEIGKQYEKHGAKAKFTDIELQFIKSRIEHPEIRRFLNEECNNVKSLVTIAVCYQQASEVVSVGLSLPDAVYDNDIPVLIKQENSCAMLAMLSQNIKDGSYRKYRNVKPFGMLEHCYDLNKADDRIPMMVNYVYDYYYRTKIIPTDFPDDDMLALWRRLSTSLKWSNRYNADSIGVKQRSFAIQPDKHITERQLEQMSIVEHNRWVIEKLLMGYRAPTVQEREIIAKDKTQKNHYKKRFIHYDICAYKDLENDTSGSNVKEYDRCISKAIQVIISYINDSTK
jgi:hypothetical protein